MNEQYPFAFGLSYSAFFEVLIKKKSVRAILLPVPHLEALELPIGVERTTCRSLTQNMLYPNGIRACAYLWMYIHTHISHLPLSHP